MEKDIVALYVNKPHALRYGLKTYISKDRSITPIRYDDQVMVPLAFFAESIGIKETAEDSVLLNGISYAQIGRLCDKYKLHLFVGEDLIIYSKKPLSVDWNRSFHELCVLCEKFIYDDVTGEEIVRLVKEKHSNNGHPRMIMTEEKFQQIREELSKGDSGDAVYSALVKVLKKNCEEAFSNPPYEYELKAGLRLMQVSDNMQIRYLSLALMYNITHEERYAVRAREEILAACSFKDWHPYHFLDTGIMVSGLGLAYDWLYHWLSEKDRAIIRKAILEKAIVRILEDYEGRTVVDSDQSNPYARTALWNKGGGNWSFVCGGGVATGALAICDDLEGEALCMAQKVLQEGLVAIRRSISKFAPDGSYGEGVGYWGFSCGYWQRHIVSLLTSTGCDFGYLDAPGVKNTNGFMLAMNGPVAKYGYHDVKFKAKSSVSTGFLFWAKYFHKEYEALERINLILEGQGNYQDIFFYEPELLHAEVKEGPLDLLASKLGIFVARSGWGKEDTWVAFHADNAIVTPTHDHNDGGSFSLQAMGEEFIFDLGSDDYNLPNYRRTAYRCRAEGHNGWLINPGKGQYGIWDMQYGGKCSIDCYQSSEEGAFAQAEITDLYREDLQYGRRGVKLDNHRHTIIVQDELILKQPSELYWFAHTRAEISLSEDGKKAYLNRNGKEMLAEILNADEATFSVLPAKPLKTSPECPGQSENEGVSKLTIHLEDVTELRLMVVFNPLDESGYNTDCDREYIPLNKWNLNNRK